MIDELQDILDEIVPDSSDCIINEDEFIDTVLQLMEEYMNDNIEEIIEEDFHEMFISEIFEIVLTTFGNEIQFYNYADCKQRIEEAADIFYETFMPPRSYANSIILQERVKVREITQRLNELRAIPQPEQRTAEWYAFRHNLITASNAYKTLMEVDSSEFNQIVFEKCKPLYVPSDSESEKEEGSNSIKVVNVETTLHWGQKYEPLSVLIYEHMYNTTIEDFGCIQHDEYLFLGASPDGINVESSSPRYGRMLEIKNIVNRDITGIPKLEYWVQMQLQMETCKLEECDFLETRFKEYEDESSYLNDEEDNYKGIIMYFSKEGKPTYMYAPLDLIENPSKLERWESKTRNEMEDNGFIWIKNIYWKLDEMSCVLVKRNSKWFNTVVHTMEKTWNTVLYEREHGYEHRKPIKRAPKVSRESIKAPNKCLISINKESGDIVLNDNSGEENNNNKIENSIQDNMKIRTESIDETRQKIEN